MQDILQALILGIIQGLTEFLPVSSSGHLELAKYLMQDDRVASESLIMTVTLHAATALATLLVFRKEVGVLLRGIFAGSWNEETQFAVKIIVSMIPAVVVGLAFEAQLEQLFDKQILLVGFMLIVTGLLLFLADRAKPSAKGVTFKDALIIGLAQAIAILPGISRSGATISTSVLLGVDRERAARFSFLMVVPLILGKMILDIKDGALNQTGAQTLELLVGFVAAFGTGVAACLWMIRLVKASKLRYFSVYCFIIAIFAIVLFLVQNG